MDEQRQTTRIPRLAKPLIQAGLLKDEDALRIANALSPGETFIEGIVRSDLADDCQIAEVLARHYHMAHVRLSTVAIEPVALRFLDQKSASELRCIPMRFNDESNQLTLAQADPLDFRGRELIEGRHHISVKSVLASQASIVDAIRQYYGPEESLEDIIHDITDPSDLEIGSLWKNKGTLEALDLAATESQPVIKLVNYMIIDAVRSRASDIHMEPTIASMKVRYRVDGVLLDIFQVPKWLQNAVISRIKILAQMDIAQRRVPQDGRIEVRYKERPVDIRVSTLPIHSGEKVVLRILDSRAFDIGIDDLGFAPEDLARIKECIKKPQGMLLTTGPTGSGKTTTLYAFLNNIRSPRINIVTIENPVEYQVVGVNQVQINERAGLTFPATLRSVLRQDPNVIMVGEIRDRETAEIALQAAMTGHLVLSTLHTNDSVSTLARLRELDVDATLLSSSLLAILAQRLVRQICDQCKVTYTPDAHVTTMVGLQGHDGKLIHGRGCDKCRNTGYHGRVGIYEMLIIDAAMREAIARGASDPELRRVAELGGLRPMVRQARDKVLAGLTTVEEVARVVQTETSHKNRCPGCQRDVEREYMVCPFCGQFLKNNCPSCGLEMKLEWNICPHCRTVLRSGMDPRGTAVGVPAIGSRPSAMVRVPPEIAPGAEKSGVSASAGAVSSQPAQPAVSSDKTRVELPKTDSVPVALKIGKREGDELLIDNEPLRVLIVDDDLVLCRLVGRFVRRVWGKAELLLAHNGKDALAEVERRPPHLILLDVNMPEMNGLEVCRKLRENIRTAFIPILIMTASPQEATQAEAFAVGTDDFLAKPISPEGLKQKVSRLLHRSYGV